MQFFFFQAEDGIRDTSVTGVQTCALPIFASSDRSRPARGRRRSIGCVSWSLVLARSEERRVGKECKDGWEPFENEKKIENGEEERSLVLIRESVLLKRSMSE